MIDPTTKSPEPEIVVAIPTGRLPRRLASLLLTLIILGCGQGYQPESAGDRVISSGPNPSVPGLSFLWNWDVSDLFIDIDASPSTDSTRNGQKIVMLPNEIKNGLQTKDCIEVGFHFVHAIIEPSPYSTIIVDKTQTQQAIQCGHTTYQLERNDVLMASEHLVFSLVIESDPLFPIANYYLKLASNEIGFTPEYWYDRNLKTFTSFDGNKHFSLNHIPSISQMTYDEIISYIRTNMAILSHLEENLIVHSFTIFHAQSDPPADK